VAQSKWDRAKAQLGELLAMLATLPDGLMNYKRLEEIRGFLGQISMTYFMVTPYLKGLHLTLASHHPGCNKFGWKMVSVPMHTHIRPYRCMPDVVFQCIMLCSADHRLPIADHVADLI
jgi:hypothetical protein